MDCFASLAMTALKFPDFLCHFQSGSQHEDGDIFTHAETSPDALVEVDHLAPVHPRVDIADRAASAGGITRPAAKLICARFIWVFESALRFP